MTLIRMNIKTCLVLTGILLTLLAGGSVYASHVKVAQVIPLPGKKTVPTIMRLDPNGNIWIYDMRTNTIQQISNKGLVKKTIRPGEGKKALFKTVNEFRFMKNGHIILLDSDLDRVAVISTDGQLKSEFHVSNPAGLALSHDDILAIGKPKDKLITIFSIDGTELYNMVAPKGSEIKAIHGLDFALDGTLWALDGNSGNVHRFSAQRKWLGKTKGMKGGQSLDVDDYGFAYVLQKKGQWSEINLAGTVTQTFGTKGKEPGKMRKPTALALMDNSHLWVVDTGNRRLQSFELSMEDKILKLDPQPSARIQIRKSNTFPVK